jgi:hypothetical protein
MSEVKIMEYNGKYRIEQGQTKGEKWYADKCIKSVWNEEKRTKEFTDKVGNLSIKLGDKETAKNVLLMLLAQLGEPIEPQATPMEDVPF